MKNWIKYILLVLAGILWGIFIGDFSEGILAILLIGYIDLTTEKKKKKKEY
jgi:hypothetical protein